MQAPSRCTGIPTTNGNRPMSAAQKKSARPLPLWLKAAGSGFAVWHLLAIALLALEARSGPWFVSRIGGPSEAEGPKFAQVVTSNATLPYYLEPLRMTHNYHFNSNRVQAQ